MIDSISSELEQYLINTNKKILLITDNNFSFPSKARKILVIKNLIYINNDIQYMGQNLLLRIIDIFLTVLMLHLLVLIMIPSYVYIFIKNGKTLQ